MQPEVEQYLKGRGIDPTLPQLEGAHLAVEGRERNRICLPIHDAEGSFVGFIGRTITNDFPKFLLPEPPFKKSECIYNLPFAASHILEEGFALVTEGNFDCLSAISHGYRNAISFFGTAVSPYQMSLLRFFTKRVVLCFDSDKAGATATAEFIKEGEKFGFEVRTLQLPEGVDLDEFLITKYGH